MDTHYDVVVVGAGNAALCAALAARDEGSTVLVLERAPREERGGNTGFTAGAMRFAYNGADDVVELVSGLTEDQFAATDFGQDPTDEFFDDLARVTEYKTDPDLAEIIVGHSFETLKWMTSKGVRFVPFYGVRRLT